MKSYVLSINGSGSTSEILADDDESAIEQAIRIFGDDAIVADQWDADGVNDDDEPCKRILFWADEASAKDDAGANSFAQLSTVGTVGDA